LHDFQASTEDASRCAVEMRGVSKRFGEQLAVDRLDLAIPRGTCFGLLGSNGAGKTTALRMIYGVTPPTGGSIHVFGIDVARDSRRVRARLGVTLQETVLIEALSAEENLRVFGRYHLLGEQRLAGRIEECLELLQLRSHSKMPVRQLSGGFRRRVAIAMSLINDPDLLILDEPTTGLDPALRLALWNLVRELQSAGKTILITTHYMEEAERLCDRVVIMNEGRKVSEDSPAGLIEDHLAPEAIEMDCPEDLEMHLVGNFPGPLRRLRSGERLFLYTQEAQPLVRWIQERDRSGTRALVVRPTNLEDVFLEATGTAWSASP